MAIIRTPDERFADLPGYPFAPRYIELAGLGGARMHYVDEGAGQVILCLHGEPSWSYLYRTMIPPLSTVGRVIAPDFLGFGRSDKFTETDDYSFQMHRDALVALLDALALRDITLVCQDWGGLIGLRVASELPERFARLVVMNTGLPTGDGHMPKAFYAWQQFALSTPDLPIGLIIRNGLAHGDQMPDAVLAAYDAPFPDARYKAGARAFPALVPTQPDQPGAAEMRRAREVLAGWTKPALVLFADGDPITTGGDAFFRELLPGARDQPEITIHDAGHFLQEERGAEIAEHIVAFVRRTSPPGPLP
ncbi:MAG TPA: haloalkane dehalogenase [Ktedonobacterales bacterium]|jgi:haloalkane dehalogenase